MHTRREVLKLGAAALTVAAGFYAAYSPWVTFGAGRDRLRQVAAKRGIRYGTCADTELFSASEYAALVASQCSMLAPNLSWERLTPHARDNAAVTWQDADISFALQNNLKLTGYHLLWYRRTPDWFSTLPDQTSAAIAVYEHIDAMAARFSRNSYSWNVVNEALNPKDGRPDGLREECPILAKIGPDYFKFAFKAAKAAAPAVMRVYNDYDMEMDTPDQEARRNALLHLLDKFQREGVPIDGVGLQSHLKMQYPFNAKIYRAFLHDIASRGLKILITELDVFDTAAPSDIGQRDRMVADIYARFLDTALDETAVKAVVSWGLSDRYTWLNPHYNPNFARKDGLPMRPLPFDEALKPKPAFYSIIRALENAPARG